MTTAAAPRTLTFRGTHYPVTLPSIRDSRLHLAAVIMSLHVLGQTVLHFELSIAQIIIAILTSATLEFVITLRRHHAIVWPASAMLTGNGVAFILRVPGTQHGEYWSLHGWWIFAGTAAISLLSKHLIRRDGLHVFNPSNFGLLVCFLVLGSSRAEPLDFWWGSNSPKIYAALAIIIIGGFVILSRLRMLAIAVTFWATFAACMLVLGLAGHCMTARWHVGPLCDLGFTRVLVTSPELLVFMFFMITDPRTSPQSPRARTIYAASIAVLAALMIAPQRTEFASKVALLLALAVVCAARPFIERLASTSRTRSTGALIRRRAFNAAVVGSALVLGTAFTTDLDEVRTTSRARPTITVNSADVPPITIDNSNRISSRITASDARTMTVDTIADMRIIAEAQRTRDTGLAKTATAEYWYRYVRDGIERAAESNRVEVERYTFSAAHIGLARRPGQGAPAVLITLRGRKTVETATSRGTGSTRTTSAFLDTLEIKFINDHWLITTDDLPPGWRQPALD